MERSAVSPAPAGRKRGRRRQFEDVDVFQQVTQILLESGLTALSLPRLAQRIGCTHQSLSDRFESRAGLLQSYAQWNEEIFDDRLAEICRQTSSPLERIRRLLIMPLDSRLVGSSELKAPGLWVTLTLELRRDPVLIERAVEDQSRFWTLFVEMVNAAQDIGELRPGNTDEMAESLIAATAGVAVLWLLHPVGDVFERMRGCLERALVAYLPEKPS